MNALERVTDALRSAGSSQRGSGNWNCPTGNHSNGDRNPSLHVAYNGRTVALKCFTGCDTKDILDALDLEWDDMFEEPLKEVARYPYHSGGQLYEKVRLAANGKKTFRWEPSLNGHRMPLYRLEEALALPGPVYLIESEKDVDALLGMDVAATCMPGGAGDWYPAFSESLRGRDVIIVADRDDAGVRGALKIRDALKGFATARIVQSKNTADHADVGDHVAAGYELSELVPYRPGNEITKKYAPIDWHAAFKEEPEDVQWLREDFLERGTLTAMFSKPGVGKSLIALEVAIEIIRNGGRAAYFDDENRKADIVDRLRSFRVKPEELENLIVYNFASLPPLDSEVGGEHLDALMERDMPDLVILDTISRMIKGSENDADTYIQLYRCSLTRLKARGIACLRLDHVGKDSARGQRGSSAKESDCDVLYALTRDGDNTFTLECTKSRSGHVQHGQLISLERHYDPLFHDWNVKVDVPVDRLEGIIRQMDALNIPTTVGRPAVRKIFKDNSVIGVSNEIMSAAIIERRNRRRRRLSGQATDSGDNETERPF